MAMCTEQTVDLLLHQGTVLGQRPRNVQRAHLHLPAWLAHLLPAGCFGDLTCAAWGRLGAQHACQAAWCRAGLLPEDAIRHAGWPCLAPG